MKKSEDESTEEISKEWETLENQACDFAKNAVQTMRKFGNLFHRRGF